MSDSGVKKMIFTYSHYINCKIVVYVGPGNDSVWFLQKIEDAVDRIVETEYGRKMFDITSEIVVTEMTNNNEWGHKLYNTGGYTDGSKIYVNPFRSDIDTILVHEIAHWNNWIPHEEGISYWNQPAEIVARAEEAKYHRSPIARESLITGRTIEEDEKRKAKEALAAKEREKELAAEQARQREIKTAMDNMQRAMNSSSIFDTEKPILESKTDNNQNDSNSENYDSDENSSSSFTDLNPEGTWRRLFGAFGSLFGVASRNNENETKREKERSGGGNPENPNRNRESSIDQSDPNYKSPDNKTKYPDALLKELGSDYWDKRGDKGTNNWVKSLEAQGKVYQLNGQYYIR